MKNKKTKTKDSKISIIPFPVVPTPPSVNCCIDKPNINNDKTIFEMINKLLTGNFYEATNLLTNFKLINISSSSILYLLKSKLILLKKCINIVKRSIN